MNGLTIPVLQQIWVRDPSGGPKRPALRLIFSALQAGLHSELVKYLIANLSTASINDDLA